MTGLVPTVDQDCVFVGMGVSEEMKGTRPISFAFHSLPDYMKMPIITKVTCRSVVADERVQVSAK